MRHVLADYVRFLRTGVLWWLVPYLVGLAGIALVAWAFEMPSFIYAIL